MLLVDLTDEDEDDVCNDRLIETPIHSGTQ